MSIFYAFRRFAPFVTLFSFIQIISYDCPAFAQTACKEGYNFTWISRCIAQAPSKEYQQCDTGKSSRCWFQGIGANDVSFMPQTGIIPEVFAACPDLQKLGAVGPCTMDEHIEWLSMCMSKAEGLRDARTKEEMEKVTIIDGGLRGNETGIYSVRGCPGFKIRAEYFTETGKSNVIKSTSKPYLGYSAMD